AVLLQLPRGEARSLKIGPRLICKDRDLLPAFHRGANHAECGAVSGGRECACVAMRQYRRALAEELRAVTSDALVGLDILGEHRLRLGFQIGATVTRAQ